MPSKNLLQPLAVDLAALFGSTGQPCAPQVLHQLLHAAIGTISPEVNSGRNLPIQQCYDAETRQYNHFAAIERAKKMLGLSDLQAVGVVEEVVRALRAASIGVNQVQLLLDPALSKVRKQAFDALCKNLDLNDSGVRLPPKTATLALHLKDTARLDTSWKSRLSLAAAWPPRGPSQLVDLVTSSECYLWVFPRTDHEATAMATIDRFFGEQRHPHANLGMGFCIIDAGWKRPKYPMHRGREADTYTHYSLHAPMWSWRVGGEWKLGNILQAAIRDGSPWANERLVDLLPGGLRSLPRIRGCASCRTLFVEKVSGHSDIPTECLCEEKTPAGGIRVPSHSR